MLSDVIVIQFREPADVCSTQVTPESDDVYMYPCDIEKVAATNLVAVLSEIIAPHCRHSDDFVSTQVEPESDDARMAELSNANILVAVLSDINAVQARGTTAGTPGPDGK